MIKTAIILLSVIPLLLHTPYLLQAWSGSRLDRLDWIFYLLTIPAVFWAAHREKPGKPDFYALTVLFPLLFLAFGTKVHHINALGVAAGVGVIFAVLWGTLSWKFAFRILPALVILLLGTPSSSYQLSLLMMCRVWVAWVVKFLLAVLCLFWIWCSKRFDLQMKRGSFFFSAAALASSFLLLHTGELYFEGESFIPEFPTHCGEFWGRSIQPDENTKRFFVTSSVKQFQYNGNGTDISVLAVQCGKDIHEIHPASHCLRTSMWTVNSEEILYLQDNFAVTEIDAQKGSFRCLVWVWYSSENYSTPGFLGFRKHFQPGGRYFTYQISVPVYEDIEHSRKQLHKFITLLKKEARP